MFIDKHEVFCQVLGTVRSYVLVHPHAAMKQVPCWTNLGTLMLVMGGIGNSSRRYVVQKISRYHGIHGMWDIYGNVYAKI